MIKQFLCVLLITIPTQNFCLSIRRPLSAIEDAAFRGDAHLVNLLILNGTKATDRALLNALNPMRGFTAEVVALLLENGATTRGLLIDDQTPIEYMQNELRGWLDFTRRHPFYGCSRVVEIKETIAILKKHERWSSRQAWYGAVVRAGLYTRAKAKGPVIYSVGLGRFVVGAPSTSAAKLN